MGDFFLLLGWQHDLQAYWNRANADSDTFLHCAAVRPSDHLHWTIRVCLKTGYTIDIPYFYWYVMGEKAETVNHGMMLGDMVLAEKIIETHLDGHPWMCPLKILNDWGQKELLGDALCCADALGVEIQHQTSHIELGGRCHFLPQLMKLMKHVPSGKLT